MKSKVFILNGSGGVGKNEFVECVKKYIPTIHYSSIAKVKRIASEVGWTGSKTDRDRKFLSDLKLLTTNYCDMAYKDIQVEVDYFFDICSEDGFIFIDIREPNEIQRAVQAFDAQSVLIINNRVKPIKSNPSDDNVMDFKYDFIIDNSGTKKDLDIKAKEFVEIITSYQSSN